MNVFKIIREWVKRLFPSKTIEKVYKAEMAVSRDLCDKISLWEQMYCGSAPWVDDDAVISLRLEQASAREFANVTLNEMSASVTNEKLDKIFKSAMKDINIKLQKALATGAMIIKPLGTDKVQYVSQSEFIPIKYDVSGRLIKVIFPEIKKISDKEYYIRLEYHSLDYEKGLTITNRAFRSSSYDTLDKEIPLDSVPQWAKLEKEISYPLMKRPAFGYYVNPIDNTVDSSFGGISIFEPGIQLIKRADIQYGRLEWEFESGERAIHVDEIALRPVKNADGTFSVPRLNERLFKGLNVQSANGEDFFKEFSPTLRQEDFIAGLNEYKREIEFALGLAYGDLSDPQSVEKTATEIKSSKKRKYNMVSAIQNNLKVCLEDLVYALAFYNSMTTQKYEFVCSFKDSILVDEETERTQDRQDVSMGVMPLWEYRMKWYGEDEQTAKKMTSDSVAQVLE